MSDENDDGVFISDEEIDLNLTQSVRRKLVMDLTKDEKIGDDKIQGDNYR